MKKDTISVKGMSCSHCEGRVNTAVSAINGVKAVKASAKKSEVVVKFDEALTSLGVISEEIKKVGYEVI